LVELSVQRNAHLFDAEIDLALSGHQFLRRDIANTSAATKTVN
jgi:hypothetical protein